MGYVDNPEALYARAIAWGLHERGHYVRMIEERRNATLRRTLEAVGSGAYRAVHDNFPGVLVHAFEPRSGAALMEWLARELSLVDIAIAVDGLPSDVARWIANLDHRALQRIFVSYRPDDLTSERATEFELERYDGVFASSSPKASIAWSPIQRALAPQDLATIPAQYLPLEPGEAATPDEVARTIEAAMTVRDTR